MLLCRLSRASPCRLRRLFSASSSADIDVSITSNGMATITLQRVSARNAFSRSLIAELRAALLSLRENTSVRVVLLASSVDKVFCAGADLKERATMSPPEVAAFVDSLRATILDVQSLPQPTIAVVNGAALGGGLELALATDMRVAGANASFGLVETRLAIIPGAGGTQLLPRLIGSCKAKELIFTGRRIDGKEAQSIGLVNYAVTEDSGMDRAIKIAEEIIPGGPIAIRAAKMAIDQGLNADLTTGMRVEGLCYAQVLGTKDRLEGLQAFKEKRPPVFKGE